MRFLLAETEHGRGRLLIQKWAVGATRFLLAETEHEMRYENGKPHVREMRYEHGRQHVHEKHYVHGKQHGHDA
jgi:antitoxin component YwqK of YwqJK toxin-antitoxin module